MSQLTALWIALFVSVVIVEAGWIPILAHFWKAYRHRGNPISLAIAALIGLLMVLDLSTLWIYGEVPPIIVATVGQILCLVICGYFHYAVRQSDSKFPDSRKKGED